MILSTYLICQWLQSIEQKLLLLIKSYVTPGTRNEQPTKLAVNRLIPPQDETTAGNPTP